MVIKITWQQGPRGKFIADKNVLDFAILRFLYKSKLSTLTETKEKSIDLFQRRIIRIVCTNMRWPKKISNEKVYEITQTKPGVK